MADAISVVSNGPTIGRVQQFSQSGDFIRLWGWDVVRSGTSDTGSNEQQTIHIPNTVTDGTYNLKVEFARVDSPCPNCSFEGSNVVDSAIVLTGGIQIGDDVAANNANALPSGTTVSDWDPTTNRIELSNTITFDSTQGFTMSETTEGIAWNAPATGPGSVQEAFENLPGIGAGNVTVGSTTDASGTTYTVTFTGGVLAHDDVPPIEPSSQLTGGNAIVDVVANGGGFEICEQPADPYAECKTAVHPEAPGETAGVAGSLGGINDVVVEPSTGNVIVGETFDSAVSGGNQRYDVYGSDGQFQGAFGWDVAGTGDPGDSGIDFEYCTSNCKRGADHPEGGANPNGLAFDPTTGHLYAATRTDRVDVFSLTHDPAGQVTGATFLRAMGTDVVASGPDDDGTAFEVCNQALNPTDVCKAGTEEDTVGSLARVLDVAIDSTGAVYTVQDAAFSVGPGRVQRFAPTPSSPPYSSFTPSIFAPTVLNGTPAGAFNPSDVVVDASDHIFVLKDEDDGTVTCPDGSASPEEAQILELDSAETLLARHMTCRSIENTRRMAINAANDTLYVGGQKPLGPSGGNGRLWGVFVVSESESALTSIDNVTPNTAGATVEGTFNPNGPAPGFPNSSTASYQLQYKKSIDSTWTSFGLPVDAGFGFDDEEVTIFLGGLESNTQYDIRIAGIKEGVATGLSAPETFTSLPTPPSIPALSSSNVTASSADLTANIHAHGSPTTYYFEYGKTPDYGHSTPVTAIGASLSPQSVQQHIEDLDPTIYHFRVVAQNDHGIVKSKDQTFTFFPPPCPNEAVRQQNGSSYLPDCRAYELVSPESAGTVVLMANGVLGQVAPYATSPARIAFAGRFGFVTGTNPPNSGIDTYVATRTAGGWQTTFPGIQGDQTATTSWGGGDLALDKHFYFNNPAGGFSANPQPPDNIPYIFEADGDLVGRWPGTSVFDSNKYEGHTQPSPDFSHMAWSSNNVDFDPQGSGLTNAPGSAYDYNAENGTTALISKTAAGADIPQEPGNTVSSDEYIRFPAEPRDFRRLPATINPGVSTDGSHILMSTSSAPLPGSFSSAPDPPVRLYMRVDDAVTYEVSRSHYVFYAGMTSDGSKVFFTSKEDLTADSSDNDTSTDLYMWSEATDSIIRVSAGSGGTGNTDDCNAGWTDACSIGTVVGSGGGATDYPIATSTGDVYFYSPELLDGPAMGVAGRQNLYLYRDGSVHFVASFQADGDASAIRFQVSPDGKHAAFITTSRLTSYDNAGFTEMYGFDAAGGELTCVSCLPSGAAPTSNVEGSVAGLFMSHDGRTFFTTDDSLVQKDSNEGADVYEFVDGRPQLITSGTGSTRRNTLNNQVVPTTLTGVSADGVNVYFGTYETLVENDHNGDVFKFYVARTGGGFPVSAQRQPCTAADECHGEGSSRPDPPPIASGAKLGSGGNAAFNRCGPLARRAKQNSMRAKRLRRRAVRMRRATHRKRAVFFQLRARRFSRHAMRQSRGAKRCRRSARRAVK